MPAKTQLGRNVRFGEAKRPLVYGIAVNLLLAVIKALAGFFGNSHALIADAVESAADVVSSTGVLIGLSYSARPADADHPHGHGKAEPLASAFVAFVLICAAIALAVESVKMIHTPHHLPAFFTLPLLVAVLVVKELMFRFTDRVGEKVGSSAVRAEAWHQRSDAVTSLAAFVGISVALYNGEGYENADDWAALLASVVIGYNGFHIFYRAVGELLDKAPPVELTERVREVALEVEGVRTTHKCFVRKMGFDLLVDLDIVVDPNITIKQAHEIAHAVQDRICSQMTEVQRVFVHVEPADDFGRRSPPYPGDP